MSLDLNQLRQQYPAMADAEDDDILEFVYKQTGADKTGSLDDFREFVGHVKPKGKPQGDTRSLIQRSVGPLLEPAKGMAMAGADLIGAIPGMLGFAVKGAEALTSPITGKPIEESKKDAERFAHMSTPSAILGQEEAMATNPAYQDLFAKPMALIDKALKGTASVAGEVTGSDPVKHGTELALLGGMGVLGAKGMATSAKGRGAREAAKITETGQRDVLGGSMDINNALNAMWKGDMRTAAADAVKAAEREVYGGVAEPVARPTGPVPTNTAPPLGAEGGVLRAFQDATKRTEEGLDLNARRQETVEGMSAAEATASQFLELTRQAKRTADARREGRQAIADRVFDTENYVKQGLDMETPVAEGPRNAILERTRENIFKEGERTDAARAVEEARIQEARADEGRIIEEIKATRESSLQERRAIEERARAEEQALKEQQLNDLQRTGVAARNEAHMRTAEASDAIQRAAERAPAEIPRPTTGFGELLQERQAANTRQAEITQRLDAIEKQKTDLQATRDALEQSNPELRRDIKNLSRQIRELNSEANTLKREHKDLRTRPISSSGKMGRQRGAIGPFGSGKAPKPVESAEAKARAEFEANLPDAYKGMAEQLWQKFRAASPETKAQEPLKKVDMTQNGAAIAAVEKVPGLDKLTDRFAFDHRLTPDAVKEKMALEKDVGFENTKLEATNKAVKWFWKAGGQLYAMYSDSTGVKWAQAKIMDATRQADAVKIEFSKPVMKAWDSLKGKEFDSLFKTMIDNEGVRLTPEQLKGEGFSPKAIKAYETFQDFTKKTLDTINAKRIAKNKPPLTGIEGYFPHLFYGDYRSFIKKKNAKGEDVVVWALSGKSPKELMELRNHIVEKTGLTDITITPAQKVSLANYGKRTSDTVIGMSEIMKMIGESSPESQAIKAVMDSYLEQRGYKSKGIFQHFKGRSTVDVPLGDGVTARGAQGYLGREFGKSDSTNARIGINAAIRYLERVSEWDKMSDVISEIGKVTADPKLMETHPRAIAEMRQYVDNYTETKNIREDAINKILHNPELNKWGAETANVMRGVMLGWNGAFLVSQVLQLMTMMPYYLTMIAKEGGGQIISGVGRSTADMAWAFNGKAVTKIGKEAAAQAEKYGFTEPHFRDEIRPAMANRVSKAYHGAMNLSLEVPDRITRRAAYMTYYHVFHDMGLRGDKLAEAAANATDTSMVNYRPQERAQVYQDLGAIGTALGTLKTFVTNQMHNHVGALQAHGAFSVPYLTLISSQALLGGMLGFYAMDEVKKLWSTVQWLYDKTTNKRMPSIEELILSSDIPDWLAYGLPSAALGVDMSSKFSAANLTPDNPTDMVPYIGALGTTGEAAIDLLKNPNKANFANLLRKQPLAPLKAAGEDMMTRDGVLLELQGGKLVGGPNRRDDEDGIDRAARYAGTRTIKESRERANARFREETRKWGEEGKKTARTNQSKENLEGVNFDINELMRYIEHGGTVSGYQNQMIQNEIDKRLTSDQRFMIQHGKNPAIINNSPKERR